MPAIDKISVILINRIKKRVEAQRSGISGAPIGAVSFGLSFLRDGISLDERRKACRCMHRPRGSPRLHVSYTRSERKREKDSDVSIDLRIGRSMSSGLTPFSRERPQIWSSRKIKI